MGLCNLRLGQRLLHGLGLLGLLCLLLGRHLVLGLHDVGHLVRQRSLAQHLVALDEWGIHRVGCGRGERVQLLGPNLLGHQAGCAARLDVEVALDAGVSIELHVPPVQGLKEWPGDALIPGGDQILDHDVGGSHQHRHAGRGACCALGGVLAAHVARNGCDLVGVALEDLGDAAELVQTVGQLNRLDGWRVGV